MNTITIFIVLAYYLSLRNKFSIDLVIWEMHGDSYRMRRMIGRFWQDPEKGRRLQAVGPYGSKKKLDLGPHFREDDAVPGFGKKRSFMLIAKKDELFTPLRRASRDLELEDEERDLLKKLLKKVSTNKNIRLEDVPKTLSLKPILYDQTSFYLESQKDSLKLHNDGDRRFVKTAIAVLIGLFGLLIIGSIVILILLMTQAPGFAAQVAQNAGQNAATIPVGLPG